MHGIRAGASTLAARQLAEGVAPAIQVRSVAFEPGAALPISCTADGVGAPPALSFQGIPEATRAVVVVCEDPDAPLPKPFVHWLVYGLPGCDGDVDAQTQHDYLLGENSKSEQAFAPASPPAGHGLHHYHFQVFALDTAIDLPAGRERADLLEVMKTHVLAWGEIVGTYERE